MYNKFIASIIGCIKAHRVALEEARKRDHRRVGADLELFFLDPLSPGSPFYWITGKEVMVTPLRS